MDRKVVWEGFKAIRKGNQHGRAYEMMLCELIKNIGVADIPKGTLIMHEPIPCRFEIERTGIMRLIYNKADLERVSKNMIVMKNIGIPVEEDATE
jgi:hypothetical protein